MTEPTTTTPPPAAPRVTAPGLPRCPAFDPARLQRELILDSLGRSSVVVLVVVALLAGSLDPLQGWSGSLLLLATLGLCLLIEAVSAKVIQRLPQIGDLLENDLPSAEAQLAQAMARRPLRRSVRLVLYHRLALLRQRQERFAEAAAICQSILEQEPVPAGQVRANLLLMLVESRLNSGDLWGAYWGLSQLHRGRLRLVELLQTLALQTRYEVMVGHDARALWQIHKKAPLAELMPAAECGALHALWAVAAARSGQKELAAWLRDRTELLCSPEQLAGLLRQTTA